MAIQGSTTGQLENISKEMIKEVIYTLEHTAPNRALVRRFTLPDGQDTLVIPKVGQMTFMAIEETQKNTNEMDIGMTTQSVSTSIVGGKVIISDELRRASSLDIWGMAGVQIGDAASRREEEDIIALYGGLNGGTKLGAAGAVFNVTNVMNIIATAKTNKFGGDLHIIHHPNAMLRLSKDLTTLGANRPIPTGFSEDRLKKFFTGIVLSAVPFFETGNISRDTNGDCDGVIKTKDAIGLLESAGIRRKRVRDESIGEGVDIIYVTHRYTAFEQDDAQGAALTYNALTPATS